MTEFKAYRSNFVYLFQALHSGDDAPKVAQDSLAIAKQQQAFVDFINNPNQQALFNQIYQQLPLLQQWKDQQNKLMKLLSAERKRRQNISLSDDDLAILKMSDFGEVLSADEIATRGVAIWNILSPLLEKADKLMITSGVDTSSFTF